MADSDRAHAQALIAGVADVSRETWDALELHVALIREWQKVQNLVSPDTLDSLWTRHVADSLQLMPLISPQHRIIDFGSGAGFPGLVLAAARKYTSAAAPVLLIESNKRKAAFLRAVARRCNLNVDVIPDRISKALSRADLSADDTVTARAVAPLTDLLEYGGPIWKQRGRGLFHKGQNVETEIAVARRDWTFDVERVPSVLPGSGVILCISEVRSLGATAS